MACPGCWAGCRGPATTGGKATLSNRLADECPGAAGVVLDEEGAARDLRAVHAADAVNLVHVHEAQLRRVARLVVVELQVARGVLVLRASRVRARLGLVCACRSTMGDTSVDLCAPPSGSGTARHTGGDTFSMRSSTALNIVGIKSPAWSSDVPSVKRALSSRAFDSASSLLTAVPFIITTL